MSITLELLLTMLRCHLAAVQSSAWSQDGSLSNGPALYLDEADTRAAIAELRRLQREVGAIRVPRRGSSADGLAHLH
jgi:hypothetical protein